MAFIYSLLSPQKSTPAFACCRACSASSASHRWSPWRCSPTPPSASRGRSTSWGSRFLGGEAGVTRLPETAAPRSAPAFHPRRTVRACQSTRRRARCAPANFDPAPLRHFAFASRKRPEYMHLRLVGVRRLRSALRHPCARREGDGVAYHAAAFDARRSRATPPTPTGPSCRDRAPPARPRRRARHRHRRRRLSRELIKAASTTWPASSRPRRRSPSADPAVRARFATRRSGPRTSRPSIPAGDLLSDHGARLRSAAALPDALRITKAGRRVLHRLPQPAGAAGPPPRPALAIYDIEHLQLFSPRSVRELLERAGFRQIEVSRSSTATRPPTGPSCCRCRSGSRTGCSGCSTRPGLAR